MTFRYSDEQWQSIVAAAAGNGHRLNREEMEQFATVLLANDRAINDAEERAVRKQAITRLEVADTSDFEQLERRRWVDQRIRAIAPARKPKGSREHLVRDALSLWFAIGNGRPGRHRQNDSPAIRFVRAVFDPVFASAPRKRGGGVLPSTIQETIEKMIADRAFEKTGLLD